MLFVGSWTLGLGYGIATLWYQIANFGRDPLTASIWVGIVGASFAAAFIAMRRYGQQAGRTVIPLTPAMASGCNSCGNARSCGRS